MGWLAEVLWSGTPDGFARAAIDALRGAGDTGEIRLESAEFTLHFEDDGVLDLHNMFDEFRGVPRLGRPAWFREFAAAQLAIRATKSIETFAEARTLLLPRLRERFYHEALALRRRAGLPTAPEADIPLRDVSPHHVAEMVCDFPTHVTTVTEADLARWGVTLDEAWSAGLANLRHRGLDAVAQIGDGAYCSLTGDSHDASRLLVPEVFARFEVQGDLVAIAPHRDTLLLAGTDDAESLAAIAGFAETRLAEPRAMSGVALRRTGGAWETYLPPPDHPAHAAFRLLAERSYARDCEEQQELLYGVLEHEHDAGGAEFVASLMHRPAGTPGGSDESYVVWTRGLDSLLPRADQVAFYVPKPGDESDGDVIGFAPWDDVMQVLEAGGLVAAQGLWPERFRVSEYPDDEALRGLGLAGPDDRPAAL